MLAGIPCWIRNFTTSSALAWESSQFDGNWEVEIGILSEMQMVAEGVETAKSLHRLIEKYHVDMPISEAIYQILFHNADPKESVYRLMTRELSSEL